MDFNVSDTSLAFSDVVGPSHVSGLESFSDFEVDSFLNDHEAHDSGVEEESVTPQAVDPVPSSRKDPKDESFSFDVNRLPSGNIREFLNALESAKAQLGMAITSQETESHEQDQSSLGILNLDSIEDTSSFNPSQCSSEILIPENYKTDDQNEYDQNITDEKLPFDGEYNSPLTLNHLTNDDTNEQEITSNSTRQSLTKDCAAYNKEEMPQNNLHMTHSQDELQYMLQNVRSRSGDGGELIDRVSMSSSISFLQSQTFPDGLFSSYTTRGSGSGTDSGPSDTNKDDQEDNEDDDHDDTLSLVHDAGDGSNGASSVTVGRPGLEGANSEPEDGFTLSGASSDNEGSMELRQSGEGGDVPPDLPGDGGGGGDGSSGHESEDNQQIASSLPSTRSSSRSSMSSCSDQYIPVPAAQSDPSGIIDISEGRGPPVGHASTDGSPPLMQSPQRMSGNFASNSMDQFDVLAASTPMIRPGKNAFQFDNSNSAEASAIGSQYLLATQNNGQRQPIRAQDNSFVPPQDGSFHLSQVLEATARNRDELENTLTDAPSLNFEAQGMTPRPQMTNLSNLDHDKELRVTVIKLAGKGRSRRLVKVRKTLIGKTPAQKDMKSKEAKSAFMVDVNSSFGLHERLSNTENSLLWKSTPRIDEQTIRATPGILFNDSERLSPVEDSQDGLLQASIDGHQSTQGRNDDTLKRLQTPGGSAEQTIPFSSFSQSSKAQGMIYNPFEDDGSLQQSINWNESKTDKDFVSGGTAKAIIAADEKSFEKDHQFDIQVTPADVITGQDWTTSNKHSSMRRSQVVGINDPNNEGEVRISFGAFMAAASEELGTLHGSDPNRPRPNFGDGTITTPSPKAPLRLIDLGENVFDHSPEDFSLYQGTPYKQTNLSEEPQTVKKVKGHSRKGSVEVKHDESVSETRQNFIDEQLKKQRTDSVRERRGSQGSVNSSHSSGSRSSSSSIIRKDKKEESSRMKKQRKQHQRTHREPDGCSSKENSTQLVQAPQNSSMSNVLKDKNADSKGLKSATGKRIQHKGSRSVQRTKSEGQNKNVEQQQPPRSAASIRPQSQSSSDDTSSLLSTGSESISFKNQQELAEFIARAVNVSPEHLGHLLNVVAGAKTKQNTAGTKMKQSLKNFPDPTPDRTETKGGDKGKGFVTPPRESNAIQSPEVEKLRHTKPIASSSPHNSISETASITTLSPIKGYNSPIDAQSDTLSTTINSRVFIQDSQDNLSEKTALSSPKKEISPPPNPFTNAHIYPTFGKTYTLKDKKKQEEPPENLDFDENTLSNDFQPVGLVSMSSTTSEITVLESPEKYTIGKHDGSFDSSVCKMPVITDNNGRHSWPKSFTNSPYKHPGISQQKYQSGIPSQQSDQYSRPITIGVPSHHLQNQVLPGISPQFSGQSGTFGFPQGFGPHSAGALPNNTPLSGTFPMQYQPHSHNAQPTPLGTLLGQVHNSISQGHYPSNMYPQDGFSAAPYMVPGGQQVSQNPGFYPGNQPPQSNTVSSGLGTRLATATQGYPWQQPTVQVGEQIHPYATAPPMGLLQLGQPNLGTRMGSTDTQLPIGPSNRIASNISPVIIPGEVKLPPVCPVGVATRSILTLHNSSSKWVYGIIKVAYCTINGAQVANSVNNPFFVPSKLIINPHTTIPIEVIFKPHLVGHHTAQLHITSLLAGSEGQQSHETLPSLVALESVGEQPDIEVLFEDSQMIDFGEMVANSRHSRPLRLVNKGKASIPIRLTITPNATSLHCFSFSNADSSPKKTSPPLSNKNPLKGFISTQKILLKGSQLNGSNEPQVTWVVFQSPKKSDPGDGPVGLPDEFTARVDIEIDSQEGPIVGSVLLKAAVGVARLHTPKSLEALTLSGVVGQRISRAFPLRNAGNISLQIDLKVEKDSKYFVVSPSRTVLRPQQKEDITVQFKPTKSDSVIDSILAMTIMPDGPVYEMLLRGMATSEKDETKKEKKDLLLSNKPVVCWGGVGVGNAVQQQVVLKHNGSPSSKRLNIRLSIQHPDFQLQNTFGKVDGNSLASIVNLSPQEELPVHILFAPSTLGLISSALMIKNDKIKSKVPLYGCGGTSELVLVDTRKLSEGYISNIGEVNLGKKNVVKVTLKNSGNRAAFIKAVCYSDVSSQTVYPPSHLSIAPNNFILQERTSKQIVIVYQPLEEDALKCRSEVSTVATVAFYTGDEGIRQQYKKYVQRNDIPYTEAQCNGPLANINFLTAFQDEDKVVEDAMYPQVPNWTQFFQSCVSRVLLMLVGSPPVVHDRDRSLDLVPMPGPSENGPHVTKEKAPSLSEPPSVMRKVKLPSEEGNVRELDNWTVLPEYLVLTAYKTLSEKGTGRIQIINFSERPLSFEFIWPAQYLTITPDSGQVPPRSQVMVVMSPRPTLHSSGINLPWGGTVYIQCDGVQKAVRVQIREEVVLEHTPFQPGKVTLQALESKEGEATPFTPALPTSQLAPLIIKNKQMQFEETLSGKDSVLELIMENTSSSSIMWDLSSVAPAYIKATDSAGDLYRATYTAFSFHKRSGVASSKSILRVPVHFQPRDPGRYSQFWDLQFKQEGTRRVHKQKIELIGQAIMRSQVDYKPPINLQSTKRKSKEPVQLDKQPTTSDSSSDKSSSKSNTKHKGMYLAESVISFPLTDPCQSNFMKVKICNSRNEHCKVKVLMPKGAFSITHQDLQIKPRGFLKVPIKFTPYEPNTNYEVKALFSSDSGQKRQLTLCGTSSGRVL